MTKPQAKLIKPGFTDNISADLVIRVYELVDEYAKAEGMTEMC